MSDMLLLLTNETQQQQQHLPTLPFDPALATFTPGMAKRATSVFATSPIVQGKRDGTGTGDKISFPLGSIVAGSYFGSNLDANQGSFVFRITPEWNGNDGLNHLILSDSTSGGLGIVKSTANQLKISLNGITDLVAVDVSGWVAGTTYNICIRWDSKNTIDGTNYVCISINDVHTFGKTATWTPAITVGGSIGIGSSTGTTTLCSDALIEGLTIFRRVLYDGQYGSDVNGGIDEVNLIAAGIDPTSLGGSWDVPFCLPTNQTAGALVSGTGEAWSHPWASNLLTDPWLSSYYGGEPWAVKFNGTSSKIDCGSNASLDNLPSGGVMQVEGWFRHDLANGTLCVVSKGDHIAGSGWYIYSSYTVLYFYVHTAGGPIYVGTTLNGLEKKWCHFVCHYDDTAKTVRSAVNGVWGAVSTAGSGAYVSDAALNLNIGKMPAGIEYWFNGSIGWINIYNDAHYTPGTNFVPPRTPTAADVEEWLLNEGTGVTATAQVNAANNGTITAGTWEPQWQPELTPVLETSLQGSSAFRINVASGVTIDDLHDGALTAEGWFRFPKTGTNQYLFFKGTVATAGWLAYLSTTGTFVGMVICATASATAISASRYDDNRWHLFKMTFDDGGDRKARLYVDDVLVATSSAGTGLVVSDAALDGYISNVAGGNTGSCGWVRWSNSIRGAGMISRIAPPAPDANTMLQLNMTEGAGTAVADSSGNGNNGTISGTYTWLNVPEMALDAPGTRMFAWGMEFGSDAANDGIKQTLTGLVAATGKYVIRAIGFSGASGLGQPYIVVYDETNGAIITSMNGDWARELVSNGGFDSDTLWTKGTGWTIPGTGVATKAAGTASYLVQLAAAGQNGGVVLGTLVKLTYTISGYSAGTLQPVLSTTAVGAIRSADGTYTDYIRMTGTGPEVTFYADAAFIGSIDNVSVTRMSEYNRPDVFIFSFELPTIARGAGADCTSISIKLLNAAGAGVVYWHQCEMLPNLLDNPSLDTGAVADPWIPFGWSTSNLDAGDTEREATIVHSSGGCIQANVGASAERMVSANMNFTLNKYFSYGWWSYNSASSHEVELSDIQGFLKEQKTLSTACLLRITTATSWAHLASVIRSSNAGNTNMSFQFKSAAIAQRYVDDAYIIALTDVSLTVTPASAANSLEGSGIRVDGGDSCSLPAGVLTSQKGKVRFLWTPRHSAPDFVKFGNNQPNIVRIRGDGNNYIAVYEQGVNLIGMISVMNGVSSVIPVFWDCTGVFVAGTTYLLEVRYSPSGITLAVNGSIMVTFNTAINFIVAPATVYFGSNNTTQQGDAVYSAP